MEEENLFLKGIESIKSTPSKRVKKFCSLIPFISADGKVLVVFLVFPRQSTETAYVAAALKRRLRSDLPIKYMFTESGYSNKAVFKEMICQFGKIWKENHGDTECILFMDRLSSHINQENAKIFREYSIQPYLFPVATTHFLQPLDDNYFKSFKNFLCEEVSHTLTKNPLIHTEKDESIAFLENIVSAIKSASTEKIIRSSFKNTGIYPWNSEIIRMNANMTGTSTKSENEKLPKNAKEIISLLSEDTEERSTAKVFQVHVPKEAEKQIYDFYDVINLREKRLEEEKKKQEEKERKKEERQKQIEQEKEKQNQKRKQNEKEAEARKKIKLDQLDKKRDRDRQNSCFFCKRRFKYGSGWRFCEDCDYYGICNSCYRDESNASEFENHDNDCPQKGISWENIKQKETLSTDNDQT